MSLDIFTLPDYGRMDESVSPATWATGTVYLDYTPTVIELIDPEARKELVIGHDGTRAGYRRAWSLARFLWSGTLHCLATLSPGDLDGLRLIRAQGLCFVDASKLPLALPK